MFTQCAKCETVFRLSAETLRAAGGEVRCGRCGEVFNALANVAEEPGAFKTGESALAEATRADDILQTPMDSASTDPTVLAEHISTAEFTDPSGPELAQLEIQRDDAEEQEEVLDSDEPSPPEDRRLDFDSEAAMEFTLPPGELDRIFVEVPMRPGPLIRPSVIQAVAAAQAAIDSPADADALAPTPPAAHTDLRFEPDEPADALTLDAVPVRWPWIAAAVPLVAALGLQLAHQNRERLAESPVFGSIVRSIYGHLGAPVPPHVDLDAFEIRQWGVTGDASATGSLRVRASMINVGASAQPYPLLRLTLADRFGTGIGRRDFKPAEYLHKTPTGLLEPGERADAALEVVDPGKSAEGFEIDVCAQSLEAAVVCAKDARREDRSS